MSSSTESCDEKENQIEDANPYKSAINPLSAGLLQNCEPNLVKVEKQLKELNDKNADLLNQIHGENLSISQLQHSDDLVKMFNLMELYQKKLVNIKKDIKNLHDKSTKLKKRALKLH